MTIDRRQFVTFLGGAAAALTFSPAPAEAAAPFKILKRFLIPRGVSSKTSQVSLAARPNGGFAALFEVDTGETFTPSFARYYGADTVSEGPTVSLAKTTYSGDYIGTIVVNDDGTANAFYFGWYQDHWQDLWWMQRLSATGRAIGKPVMIGNGSSGNYHLAAKLTGGNILAAWRGSTAAMAKVVTPTGTVVGQNLGGVCDGTLEGIAALPNGGAVAAYFGPDLKASFQRLTGTAKRTGKPIAVPSLYSFGGVAVASHPNGFVGVWKNADGSGNPLMQGAVYSATGTKLATLATVRLRPSGSEDKYRDFFAVAHALADGRVIVVYDSLRRPDPNASKRVYEIIGVLYAANGKIIGKQVLYAKTATTELWDYLTRPRSLIQLTDGRFVLGYDGGYEFGIQQAQGIIFQLA